MKHKYAEMIKSKAENMDLVIIVKNCQNNGDWWALKSDKEILPSFSNGEYFACLPQHKEAVLNSLNGGDSQLSFNGENWTACNCNQPIEWNSDWWYMRPESQSRIKPKKEKRLLAINGDQVSFANSLLCYPQETQFIEIEIEVEV